MALGHELLIPAMGLDRDLVHLSGHHRIDRRLRRRGRHRSRSCSHGLNGGRRSGRSRRGSRTRSRRGRRLDFLGIRSRATGRSVFRRIRSVVVEAGNHDFERLRLRRSVGNPIPLRKRCEVHVDAFGGERADATPERTEAVDLLVVERDCDVCPIPQAPSDQLGEHTARTHFDEVRDARGMHSLDHLAEADRRRELIGQQAATRLRGLGINVGGLVRIDVDRAGPPLHVGEVLVERLAGTGHDAAVKGGCHRQTDRTQPGRLELVGHRIDRLDRTREHDLRWRIVVRDHDVVRRVDQARHGSRITRNGNHRTGRTGSRLGHQFAPLAGRSQERALIDPARRGQSRELTEAVPGDRIGLDAQRPQQMQEAETDRRNGGLSRGHSRDIRGLLRPLFVGEGRRREDRAVEPVSRELFHVGGRIPDGARPIEGHGCIGTHTHVLTSLPREDEGELPYRGSPEAEADVGVGQRFRMTAAESVRRLGELRRQFVGITRDDRDTSRSLRIEGVRRVGRDQAQRVTSIHARRRITEPGCQAVRVRGGQHDQFVRPRPQAFGTATRARVLLERHMKIRTAEAERADRPTSRVIAAPNPRARFRIDVQRPVMESELCVRLRNLERRGQHAVVERQRDLDQARGARGGLRVADLRLHGAQCAPCTPLFVRRAEHRRQTARLSCIAGLGSGPVCFDELDRGRAVVRVLVRASERLGLPFGAGRVDAGPLSVRGRSEAANDRVDLVTVPLGILEAPQREHAHALTDQGPVRVFRKRPAVARGGERRRLREAHVHEDVVEGVHAPRDHHVTVAEVQLMQAGLERRDGAGAGGIRDEVRTAQVEAIRDTTCDHVAEQAGERAFLPRLVMIFDELNDFLNSTLGKAGLTKRVAPNRVVEP